MKCSFALAACLFACATTVQAQHHRRQPPSQPAPTPPPAPTPATLLWSSEFDTSADIAAGPGQRWLTSWPLGSGYSSAATAGEVEVYVDVQNGDKIGPNPFTQGQSLLCITATPTAGLEAPFTYTSGMLSTYGLASWSPPFYAECRCMAPTGSGAWPLFEFFYGNGTSIPFSWPPELDVFQYSSRLPTQYYPAALVSSADGQGAFVSTPNLSAAMHTYGMNVTASEVDFYFDGTLVFTRKVAIKGPLWATLNLGVGDDGGWIGPPDGSTFKWWIDYVRIYNNKPS